MKTVWITSLARDEARVGELLGISKRYGLAADGHFWVDDLKHMAWQGPVERLLQPETVLWMILGTEKEVAVSSIRYGLSLLALSVQAQKGQGFPVLWLDPEAKIAPEKLPTPLRGAEVLKSAQAAGAKMAARANMPVKKLSPDYRMNVHANPGYGVWLEIGPEKGHAWTGALLGVAGGDIDAHGVGGAGELPSRSVLEYPAKGLKVALGDREYTAWGVQNRLDETLSYYVRITDVPSGILFGPYAQNDEAEMHVMEL